MKDCALADHIFYFRPRPGIDMKLKPGLHQIAYHGFPHDSNSYKTYFMHLFYSSCSSHLPLQTAGLSLSESPGSTPTLFRLFNILHFLHDFPLLLIDTVRRHISPDAGKGIDIGMASHHASGIQHRTASDFHLVPKHGSELFHTRLDITLRRLYHHKFLI